MRPLVLALAGTLLLAAGPSAGKPYVGSRTCFELLQQEGVMDSCKKDVAMKHPFSEKPLDSLTDNPISEHRGSAEACAGFIQEAECVNEQACSKCDYDDAQIFGNHWYEVHKDIIKNDGCKATLKAKCQLNMKRNPGNVDEDDVDEDASSTTTKKSSATLVVIIVVVVGFLIVGGVVVYCLFFSGSKDEKKAAGGVEPKTAASKGGPKTTKEVSGKSAKSKSASKSKSTKGVESSAKASGAKSMGVKSTAKSALKSSISAGGKSKAKSSVADSKNASKVASGMA